MRKLATAACLIAASVAVLATAIYSALPGRIAAVALIVTGDTEVALKIVGDRGGDVTRTFKLPAAPSGESRLGLALRPATYLKAPSGEIEVRVGSSACRFGPSDYTDGGTISCPVAEPGTSSMRITVKGATGPLALIERQTRDGKEVAGVWVHIPPRSLEGRVRFVLTALSTTRPGLFSWPLAIFGFGLAICATIWLCLGVFARDDAGDETAVTPEVEPEPATPV